MSGPTTHPNLIYYVGDTILIDVTVTDARGNVVQLNGIDAKWVLDDPGGNNVAICTIGNGIKIVDVNGGKIEITVPATTTVTYAPGWYNDQLRIKFLAEGQVITQMVGLINIKPSLGGANPMLL
jgi:hypothetical protein